MPTTPTPKPRLPLRESQAIYTTVQEYLATLPLAERKMNINRVNSSEFFNNLRTTPFTHVNIISYKPKSEQGQYYREIYEAVALSPGLQLFHRQNMRFDSDERSTEPDATLEGQKARMLSTAKFTNPNLEVIIKHDSNYHPSFSPVAPGKI